MRELWSRALAAASVEIRGGAARQLDVSQSAQVKLLRQEVALLRDRLQREAQGYGELRAQSARHKVIAKDALTMASVEARLTTAHRDLGAANARVAELEARARRYAEANKFAGKAASKPITKRRAVKSGRRKRKLEPRPVTRGRTSRRHR